MANVLTILNMVVRVLANKTKSITGVLNGCTDAFGRWGTSWWTEVANGDRIIFVFKNESDLTLFLLYYGEIVIEGSVDL